MFPFFFGINFLYDIINILLGDVKMSYKDLVLKLIDKKKTVATMESCTGGGVANQITNIEGASEVLRFSAVTYSNFGKIKMGVNPLVIDKYSVYSEECSIEMSKNISLFAGSDYGIGITGKLNRVDINNPYGDDNVVFVSIYDRDNDKFYNEKIEAGKKKQGVLVFEVPEKTKIASSQLKAEGAKGTVTEVIK